MNVAFLVCWGTYVAFCFIYQYIDDSQVGQMLSMLPSVAIKLNVCINPILYIAFNPHFRSPVTARMIRNENRKDLILKRVNSLKKNRNIGLEDDGLDSNLKSLKLILKETKTRNNFLIRSLRKKKRKQLILKKEKEIN